MAEGRNGFSPPILTLLDSIDEHRGALEYDWRNRLHTPLKTVPSEMGWDEAWRAFEILASDPSTRTAAAFADWEYPLSRSELALMDHFDLSNAWITAKSGSKAKAVRYPRPWRDQSRTRTKPQVSQEEVLEALRFAGHTAPLPTL